MGLDMPAPACPVRLEAADAVQAAIRDALHYSAWKGWSVGVASGNKDKIEAARLGVLDGLHHVFGAPHQSKDSVIVPGKFINAFGRSASSNVAEQPVGQGTFDGAHNRLVNLRRALAEERGWRPSGPHSVCAQSLLGSATRPELLVSLESGMFPRAFVPAQLMQAAAPRAQQDFGKQLLRYLSSPSPLVDPEPSQPAPPSLGPVRVYFDHVVVMAEANFGCTCTLGHSKETAGPSPAGKLHLATADADESAVYGLPACPAGGVPLRVLSVRVGPGTAPVRGSMQAAVRATSTDYVHRASGVELTCGRVMQRALGWSHSSWQHLISPSGHAMHRTTAMRRTVQFAVRDVLDIFMQNSGGATSTRDPCPTK